MDIRKSEFSGIKLLKKAVKKVNKKVSGHTYVQIRNQVKTYICAWRDYSETK